MQTMNLLKCAVWLLECRKVAAFVKGLLTVCTVFALGCFGAKLLLSQKGSGKSFKKLLKKVAP